MTWFLLASCHEKASQRIFGTFMWKAWCWSNKLPFHFSSSSMSTMLQPGVLVGQMQWSTVQPKRCESDAWGGGLLRQESDKALSVKFHFFKRAHLFFQIIWQTHTVHAGCVSFSLAKFLDVKVLTTPPRSIQIEMEVFNTICLFDCNPCDDGSS